MVTFTPHVLHTHHQAQLHSKVLNIAALRGFNSKAAAELAALGPPHLLQLQLGLEPRQCCRPARWGADGPGVFG